MDLRAFSLPRACANLACSNHIGEGRWVVLVSSGDVVGGHRPLVLSVCAPCAEVLPGAATTTRWVAAHAEFEAIAERVVRPV